MTKKLYEYRILVDGKVLDYRQPILSEDSALQCAAGRKLEHNTVRIEQRRLNDDGTVAEASTNTGWREYTGG
jgi:hypothetical protein